MSLAAFQANAQVLLSEDFETSTSLPTGWTNIKVDNGTANSNVSALNAGWTVRTISNPSLPNSTKSIGSTSWFTNTSISADRWLISPSFTPTANNTYLSFDVWSQDADYLDGYEVYISPTGGNTVADFTDNLLSVTAAPNAVTKKIFDLSSYVGQNITFAIRHRGLDKYILFADNFLVEKPTIAFNVNMRNVTNPDILASGQSYNFKTAFTNSGYDTITSATVYYQVDANTPVSENISSFSTPYFSTKNHTFSTVYSASGTGAHTVKFWITNINGGADKSADTISHTFNVASKSVDRKVIIEHFTNTNCGPCASQNPGFKTLMNQFPGKLTSIKYHPNFPGPNDPFYLFNKTENMARLSYYDVDGVPTAIADGNGHNDLPGYYTSSLLNNLTSKPAFMDISIVAQNVTDRNIDISVEVKPYIDNGSTNTVLHVVVVEDITTATAPGTNGEKDFPQVMRKMLPNQNGTTITGFSDGDVITKTFTYTADTTINLAKSKVVAFVQQVGSKYVYQSEEVSIDLLNAINESNVNAFTLYPNPASSFTNLSFDLKNNSEVDIAISTIDGKIISTQNYGKLNAGKQNIQLNTANLSTGIYFISIKNEFGMSTTKLIVE